MPVPSQGHYGFHSFPVVEWFCLFIYLWVLTFVRLFGVRYFCFYPYLLTSFKICFLNSDFYAINIYLLIISDNGCIRRDCSIRGIVSRVGHVTDVPLKRCRNSVLKGTSWCTTSYLNLHVHVEKHFLINTTSNYTRECVELVWYVTNAVKHFKLERA